MRAFYLGGSHGGPSTRRRLLAVAFVRGLCAPEDFPFRRGSYLRHHGEGAFF